MVFDSLKNNRIHNRLPVAREGIPFLCIGGGITLLCFYIGSIYLTCLFIFLTLFTAYFFRDPERKSDFHEKALLTPADGKILDIRVVHEKENPLEVPAVKISVFMSIFNVHVNRIPISGKILKIIYHSGKFFSANLDKASTQNENNRVILETQDGQTVMIVQIAGLIARRIACWVKEGDSVLAGQRFGLIRFGSRLDLYLPEGSRITVQPKDKVKAGKSILGYLS